MTAPRIYNSYSVVVSTSELASASIDIIGSDPKNAGGWIGGIIDCLNKIDNTIKDLKLGWVGDSATEAQAFFDRWSEAMTRLFGSTKHPEDGTLVLLAGALGYSANNYNSAEDTIIAMLSEFNTAITPVSTDTGGDPTAYLAAPDQWTTEWWQGAVSEVF